MRTIKKIITHGGQFHADEILAIAVMKLLDESLPIERKFKIHPIEYNDPKTMIIDVGRFYDPAKLLFDHHQDKTLMASNLLVLDAFYEELGAKFGLDPTESFRMYMYLMKNMFMYVSNVDRGITRDLEGTPTFNAQIRSLNAIVNEENENTESFVTALSIATLTLKGHILSLKLIIDGEKEWQRYERFNDTILVQEDGKIIPHWKELAKKQGIMAVLQPNVRGGWQLVSRDTDELQFPEADNAVFRHPSGFMIVFKTRSEAEAYAANLNYFYGTK